MIYQAHLDPTFWAEVVNNIIYILNHTCSHLLPSITPFDAYSKKKPFLFHIQHFGCKVYNHVPDKLRKKLDAKSCMGLFIKYLNESKAYQIWNLIHKKVIISQDIIVDEYNYKQEILSKENIIQSITLFEVLFRESP